jgi:hypothetical protein
VIWKYISKNIGFRYSETINNIKPTVNSLILITVGVTDMSLDIQPYLPIKEGKVDVMKAYRCYLRIRDTNTCVCKVKLLN